MEILSENIAPLSADERNAVENNESTCTFWGIK